jgi:hypothetical protein
MAFGRTQDVSFLQFSETRCQGNANMVSAPSVLIT